MERVKDFTLVLSIVFSVTDSSYFDTATADHNRLGIIQGQLDIPLNETGISQAEVTGAYLAKDWSKEAVAAYASDLSRASKTAEVIARYQNDCVVHNDVRLRERYLGALQGNRRPPKYNDTEMGCEPRETVTARVLEFWDALFPHKSSTPSIIPFPTTTTSESENVKPVRVFVVTHGAAMHSLIEAGLLFKRQKCYTTAGLLSSSPRMVRLKPFTNCCITRVIVTDTGKSGPDRWVGKMDPLAYDEHLVWEDEPVKTNVDELEGEVAAQPKASIFN